MATAGGYPMAGLSGLRGAGVGIMPRGMRFGGLGVQQQTGAAPLSSLALVSPTATPAPEMALSAAAPTAAPAPAVAPMSISPTAAPAAPAAPASVNELPPHLGGTGGASGTSGGNYGSGATSIPASAVAGLSSAVTGASDSGSSEDRNTQIAQSGIGINPYAGSTGGANALTPQERALPFGPFTGNANTLRGMADSPQGGGADFRSRIDAAATAGGIPTIYGTQQGAPTSGLELPHSAPGFLDRGASYAPAPPSGNPLGNIFDPPQAPLGNIFNEPGGVSPSPPFGPRPSMAGPPLQSISVPSVTAIPTPGAPQTPTPVAESPGTYHIPGYAEPPPPTSGIARPYSAPGFLDRGTSKAPAPITRAPMDLAIGIPKNPLGTTELDPEGLARSPGFNLTGLQQAPVPAPQHDPRFYSSPANELPHPKGGLPYSAPGFLDRGNANMLPPIAQAPPMPGAQPFGANPPVPGSAFAAPPDPRDYGEVKPPSGGYPKPAKGASPSTPAPAQTPSIHQPYSMPSWLAGGGASKAPVPPPVAPQGDFGPSPNTVFLQGSPDPLAGVFAGTGNFPPLTQSPGNFDVFTPQGAPTMPPWSGGAPSALPSYGTPRPPQYRPTQMWDPDRGRPTYPGINPYGIGHR
jgi:hypothetical protein